ncbi:unnamed protein product [Prunus brigantina]
MDPNKNLSFSEGFGSWANIPIDPRQFSMMPPPNLPLPPSGSFQGWRQQPYWMSHAEGMGGASSSSANHGQLLEPNPGINAFNQGINAGIANRLNNINTTPAIAAAGNNGGKNRSSDSDDDHANGKAKTVTVDGVQVKLGKNADAEALDPKKLKRIISNRASAQKSRLKKLQYIAEMERKAKALEAQIAFLAPQVEFYTHHKHYLQMEQKALNQQIAAYAKDKLMKDAEIEANKKEVARLRELQLSQQKARLQANANESSRLMNWEQARLMEQMANSGLIQSGRQMEPSNSRKEQAGERATEVKVQKQLNVAKEKEKQQNQLGQASMAGPDPGPGQTENASSSQPKPEPKGDVDDDMKSEDGVKEMEGVVTFKTEPNQKEHTFI